MVEKKNSSGLLALNVRLFVIGISLLLLVASLSLVFVYQHFLEQSQQRQYLKQTALLAERVDKKERILQAATLLLANNDLIQEAMSFEDRKELMRQMAGLRDQFGYWTGYINYAFHVITHDGRSLYRTYDPESYGQDVSSHSLMVKAMGDVTKNITAISKGGYGNVHRIINSQPVFAVDDPEQLVGFMTVSQGLRQIVLEYAKDDLGYYVFERDEQTSNSERFVVDGAPYFADREHSDWQFTESQLSEKTLQLRDGWYYQTVPIYDGQNQLQAFHLIFTPQSIIHDQAWEQTLRVLWIFMFVFVVLLGGGIVQLSLLQRTVVRPVQSLMRSLENIIKTEQYDQTVSVTSQNEIGQVTKLFNHMLNKTEELIFDLNYQKMAIDQTLILSKADPFGTITDVNANFCSISGFSREELVGQPHSIVRHPNMDSRVFKELWQTIKAKKIWQGEVQNRRKDGSSYFVMSYIIPILNREGKIQEYLSIREDVTQIVELRENLQTALVQAKQDKQKAELANKAKSEFLASMSHELRTPLNAIIGYAQLLALVDLQPKQLKQVNIIHQSSKHLLALINDILDFAKLESGKVQFNFEVLEVKELVTDALDLTRTQAKQQGIAINFTPLSDNLSIEVDRLRFKQVLLNLLTNAIKYNKPDGEIFIHCQQISQQQTAYWQLIVRDTGVGVKTEDLDSLFEPFNRLGHESSTIQGTGIGLSITKDLVEQMHGKIEVESQYGEGTSFHLFFPVVNAPKLAAIDQTKVEDGESAPEVQPSCKLLFISHDPNSMQALVTVVQAFSQLELKVAPSAENGLLQLQQFCPDLVLVDENAVGLEALVKQLDAQAQQYRVVKPSDTQDLQAIIQKCLGNPVGTLD